VPNLPNCSFLLLDIEDLRSGYTPLLVVLSNLTLSQLALAIRFHPLYSRRSLTWTYGTPLMKFLGLDDPDAFWTSLEVLIFEGYLWYDEFLVPITRALDRTRLSLSGWSFRVLVVRFHPGEGDEELVVDLFLNVDPRDQPTFLIDTERIEFSGGAKGVEKEFRKAVEEKKKVGLSEFEKRIASMIVFVDEDGMERRLLDQ